MATDLIKVPFGKDPINFGDYDELVAQGKTSFDILNRVNRYGCEWESLYDGNTDAPATLNTTTGVITLSDKWRKTLGDYNVWLWGHGYRKIPAENVEDSNQNNKTQQTINDEVKEAIGTGGSVDTRIANAINALDATKSQTAGADGLALSITEENGKITDISGSIAANTYDAHGAASIVKSELLGSAATDYNTLGKLEDKIQAEASRAGGVENSLGGRISTLETAVGSVDSRIAAAKAEIKGNATSACDTLGEAEALIAAETSARQSAVSAEASRAQAEEGALRQLYENLTQSDIVVVADHTAEQSPSANTIYREQGTNSYIDWMYYNNAWQKMAEYDNGIDDYPTQNSGNLVKSGGVSQLAQKTQYYFCPVWRSSRRLIYEKSTKTLKLVGTKDSASIDTQILNFYYKGVNYIILDTVTIRVLSELTGNNAGLFLPESSTTVQYTISDLVVFNDALEHSGYVKIAHFTWRLLDQSDIILSDQLYNFEQKVEEEKLAIVSQIEGFNYNEYVMTDSNISSDGTITTYSGRGALFYKLKEKGVAETIDGCQVLAYQWYSGYPDYVFGTNSLGRTTTNTPPADATYGGLTISMAIDYSNITIGVNSVVVDKINSLASFLNNSVGENCFANGVRTNLKILAYGNSFMRNSIAYLSAIAKNGCNVNMTIGNLYTGGTELQNHYTALLNNTNPYAYYKYTNGEAVIAQTGQTAMRGLLDERWDAIILHQYIPWEYPFEPTLNNFLKLIIERIGYTPKIYINATWAGSVDGGETYYGYQTEEEMWTAMLDYVKQACEDSGVQEFSIIPTGTAIQNARTLSWADSYNRFVNAGTDLHHLNPAGGFIAACTVFQKIVTPLNGVPCSNTTFRITSDTAMPPSSDVQDGILVTDSNYLAMCQAAIDAVNNPYVVTNQN